MSQNLIGSSQMPRVLILCLVYNMYLHVSGYLQEESKTHCDFKRTSQQTLDSYQEEINLLKRNSASAVIQN